MSLMMTFSRPLLFLLAGMFFTGCLVFPASAQPRDEIALFQYDGVIPDHSTAAKFGVFRGILKDKLLNIRREVSQDADLDFGYLDRIHIRFMNEDLFSGQDNIKKWMKSQATVLGIFRGTILSDDNVTYVVRSNFHLGDLKNHYPDDVIKIQLPVKSSEFGNTKDSHTLVILYALAMDAKRLGYHKHHIAVLLKSANDTLADIMRRDASLSGDLALLQHAISSATQDILED